jgi:hypothetical protein
MRGQPDYFRAHQDLGAQGLFFEVPGAHPSIPAAGDQGVITTVGCQSSDTPLVSTATRLGAIQGIPASAGGKKSIFLGPQQIKFVDKIHYMRWLLSSASPNLYDGMKQE